MNNKKILYEGNFLRLIDKNGWEYLERTNCTGIAVMAALTVDNELLLVEQFRPPINAFSIELPAGLINDLPDLSDEEDGLEAAKRELLEETGYVSDHWSHVFSGPGGAGSSSDSLSFYLALNCFVQGAGGGDSTEKIVTHAIPLAAIDQWLETQHAQGKPVDPKIYAGLYFLNKYNKVS